jgi:hypothetical protein
MILRGCAIALVGGALCFLLSELGSRYVKPIATVCAILVLLCAVGGISGVNTEFFSFLWDGELYGVARDTMKILGVGYVFGITADTLETLGEGSISRALDICCRVEITLISLPYIKEIISFGLDLIK